MVNVNARTVEFWADFLDGRVTKSMTFDFGADEDEDAIAEFIDGRLLVWIAMLEHYRIDPKGNYGWKTISTRHIETT